MAAAETFVVDSLQLTSSNECHISVLPNEVLLNIFSRLSESERSLVILNVCKRFCQIIKNTFLLDSIAIHREVYDSAFIRDGRVAMGDLLGQSLSRVPNVKTVCYQWPPLSSEPDLRAIARYCPDIEVLFLSNLSVNNAADAELFFKNCKKLQKLKVYYNVDQETARLISKFAAQNLRFLSLQVSGQTVLEEVGKLFNLKVLHLAVEPESDINFECLTALKYLEDFKLISGDTFKNNTIYGYVEDDYKENFLEQSTNSLLRLFSHETLKNLKTLILEKYYNELVLQQVVQTCKNLKKVSFNCKVKNRIQRSDEISEMTVLGILNSNSHLEYFEIRNSVLVQGCCLETIHLRNTSLRHIAFFNSQIPNKTFLVEASRQSPNLTICYDNRILAPCCDVKEYLEYHQGMTSSDQTISDDIPDENRKCLISFADYAF